ncbi:S41 family peptidase [uncultured Acetobacteroides sp.]|uniref:S41 family peptidase n=1 Tax=uncultured Acetobacteroides sp. TaxID=1760811 RepID=UPI0029F51CFB|nr:S41 family peptidase [uncultured Acetobacteroides sp.]
MKRLAILFLLIVTLGAFAQTDTKKLTLVKAQWPIKGANPGEGIIGKPGQYIKGESNYDNLFIEAKEGDAVVAPEGGTIMNISYIYRESLTYMTGTKVALDSGTAAEDKQAREAVAANLKKHNRSLKGDVAKFVSQSIGIRTASGAIYWISGLHPTKLFKTGDKVSKGDQIGSVGYAYSAFDKPHISISRSIDSKPADPMGVFGIPTSFVKAKPKTFDFLTYRHPVDSLKKDFSIFRKSLEQVHPGLYDYTSKAQMDSLFNSIASKLNTPMTSRDFMMLLKEITAKIRDSHTFISGINPQSIKFLPPVMLAYDGKGIVVTGSSVADRCKVGERIAEVNGISSATLIEQMKKSVTGDEGYNTLHTERYLMEYLTQRLFIMGLYEKGGFLNLKTESGKLLAIPCKGVKKTSRVKMNSWAPDSVGFTARIIKPNLACLDINTFQLNQVEEDSIASFVARIERLGVKNLIVDVRDNGGGEINVGTKIISYFIDKPLNTFSYRMVKSNTTYPILKYSDSWLGSQVIFPEFKAVAGKDGFYSYGEDSTYVRTIVPNEKIHFSGRIFLLANEYSRSMASDFASALVGQASCTIVGRETGSSYYQMNAEKFADMLLFTTNIKLHIPMVKCVFRDTPNPRIPYGHGVIPDYNVPLTLNELTQPKDVILDRAMEVIEGKATAKE